MGNKLHAIFQYLRHFSKTLDFACAPRTQNQGFLKNGDHVDYSVPTYSASRVNQPQLFL